jgi:hypothetical protein
MAMRKRGQLTSIPFGDRRQLISRTSLSPLSEPGIRETVMIDLKPCRSEHRHSSHSSFSLLSASGRTSSRLRFHCGLIRHATAVLLWKTSFSSEYSSRTSHPPLALTLPPGLFCRARRNANICIITSFVILST